MTGLYACATIPKGAVAVKHFDKERYLGKWYEIARLDFKYEKDLDNTTAEYSLNDNGTIKVDNQGYNTKKRKRYKPLVKQSLLEIKTPLCLKYHFLALFMQDIM